MAFEVRQVRLDRIGSLRGHEGHDLAFVVGFGLPRFHGDGSLGTLSHACAQTVAEQVAHEAGLAVDDLKRPLGAAGDANPASVTLFPRQ